MKSNTLIILLVLSAFLSQLSSSTAKDVYVPVLDVEGREVKSGFYYLLPAIEGLGGGVELAKTGNQTCPLTIVLSPNQNSNGEALAIESKTNSRVINQGFGVWIGFASPLKCAPSFQWTVEKGSPSSVASVQLITSTKYLYSELESFSFQKVSSQFPIYKLTFCRRQDPADKMAPICDDIGIDRDENGYARLVATQNIPLPVVLKRVNKSSA